MMIKIAMSNFIVRLFCWYKDNKNLRTTGERGAGGGAPFGGLTIRKSLGTLDVLPVHYNAYAPTGVSHTHPLQPVTENRLGGILLTGLP